MTSFGNPSCGRIQALPLMNSEKMKTPYYLIDESRLLKNLEKIAWIREHSGAKVLLALKCFSTWSVFPLISKYLDGTTGSGLFEARLGYEEFGKETHAYSVGYTPEEIYEVRKYADKIIFNSVSQLELFYNMVTKKSVGIRVNPGFSYSRFDLADPAREYSRLGVNDPEILNECLHLVDGLMFHFNCENDCLEVFLSHLREIEVNYIKALAHVRWISLGGGISFTKKGYDYKTLSKELKRCSKVHGVQIYLEPGESVITECGELVTSVVDLVENEEKIAIVDASVEAHLIDLMTYRLSAKINTSGKYRYMIAGRSCLAGDVFGTYNFKKPIRVGDVIRVQDAAGYSMVKMNWFNGLQMPSIVIKRLKGEIELVKAFNYNHFKSNLS